MQQIETPLPYPTVHAKEDRETARLIAPLYAGKTGELTCISQCLYQSIRLSACDREIAAELAERTAEEDTRHFQLLGKALCALGVDPVLSQMPPKKSRWHDTSAVRYAAHPGAMILDTVLLKKRMAATYLSVAAAVRNEEVAHLLTRIAVDEKKHLEAMMQTYRALCR